MSESTAVAELLTPARGVEQVGGQPVFDVNNLALAMQLGEHMSHAPAMVPRDIRGQTGACIGIVLQAMSWRMNPFALAQRAYVIPESGRLSYEANAFKAACVTTGATYDMPEDEPVGDWSVLLDKAPIRTGEGKGGGDKFKKGWSDDDERGLGITITGTLYNGKVKELTLYLSQIKVRNSPLWNTDPYQQMVYQGTIRWIRRYAPTVLLGVNMGGKDERDVEAAHILQRDGASMTQQERLKVALEPIRARMAGELPPPSLPEVLGVIAKATTRNEMEAAVQMAMSMADTPDKATARAAYSARLKVLKGQASQATRQAEQPAERDRETMAGEPVDAEFREVGEGPGESQAQGQADQATSQAAGQAPGAEGADMSHVTLAYVLSQFQHATKVEQLELAADLIRYLPTEEDREAATNAYNELRDASDD